MYPKYTKIGSVSADTNIKEIVNEIIYGSDGERPRSKPVVWQKLMRDADGQPIRSDYTYKSTGEGKIKERGPATTKEGFYCDEYLIQIMHQPPVRLMADDTIIDPGVVQGYRDIMVFSPKDRIKEYDSIVTIELTENGDIVSPVTATREYTITKTFEMHTDNGILQYIIGIAEVKK